MGISAWLTLSGFGFYRLFAAEACGGSSRSLYAAGALAVFYLLGFVQFAAEIWAQERTIPLLLLALGMLACWRYREKLLVCRTECRGSFLAILGHLVLLTGFFGEMREKWRMLFNLDADRFLAAIRDALFLPAALWLALEAAAHVLFWRDRKSAHAEAITRKSRWNARFCLVVLVAIIVPFCHAGSISNLVVAESLLPGVMGAVWAGLWLARRRTPPSRWRVLVCCGPLAAAALVTVTTAGMLAAALERLDRDFDSENTSPQWVWHTPELIRGPIAALLAQTSNRVAMGLYTSGLPSVAALKAETLAPSMPSAYFQRIVWHRWAERDRAGAMAAVRAVPVSKSPRMPATPYDGIAGYCIGRYGTADEIRARLAGGYSDALVCGLFEALVSQGAASEPYHDAAVQCYEQSARSAPLCEIWQLLSLSPKRAIATAQKYLRNPTPANLERFQESSRYWRLFDAEFVLLEEALASENAAVRKAALCNSYPWGSLSALKKHVPRLITSAEGSLPNSDPDEQRYAAQVLDYFIGQVWTSSVGAGTSAPLTPAERAFIAKVCTRAREKFKP